MTKGRFALTMPSSTLISALAHAGTAPGWQALAGSWILNRSLSDTAPSWSAARSPTGRR